ncbi:amino acid adenylation domain-containing protein [Nocardia sp. R6R-6]|uniref:amino acid adenylation domain-containing protein n=1 Tax=Nocardia sp. R6R-6 TaxID=3459303 RepID=UPI00403DF40B
MTTPTPSGFGEASVHANTTPATTTGPDRTTVLPQLLDTIAATAPAAPAVQDAAGTLTWAELAQRVEHLSNRLVSAGIRPSDRVGLILRHSRDLLIAALAAMRVGAVYVPVDPAYPAARTRYITADAGWALLITDQDSVPPGLGVPVIRPDGGSAEGYGRPYRLDPDDLACIIYTSGSTGEPKGVMITHRGLSGLVFAADAEFGICLGDRSLMLASAAFSASLEELFAPLVHGATCVFPPDRMALSSVRALLRFIEAESITLLGLQPHQWHLLAAHVTETGGVLPPSLRLVVVGGDRALPHAARLWDRLGVPLVHVYGSTETTATATYWTVPPGRMPADGILSLGDPIPGVRLHLVDQDLRPVPDGAVGELLIGGAALARGYWGRPTVTAQRFVPDPFCDDPTAVLYRTGDLARRLPDGRLQFIDRADHQLKVRGHRVEPSEVEAALLAHPQVRQALVAPWADSTGQRRLVGYVSAEPGTVTQSGLREFVAAQLPAYLVPSIFVRVDEFPLTVHRKIDRAALPAPQLPPPESGNHLAPADPLAGELCRLAADLLGRTAVGPDDDFLDLGGDSLFIMRLISELELRHGVHVEFAEAFADRTSRQLAARVRRSETSGLKP